MATNNKRRDATRRQLEAQLRERQIREARRKRAVLIGSISGTVVVVALVVILVIAFAGGSHKKDKNPTADKPASTSPSAAASSTAAAAPVPVPKIACTKPTGKATTTFDGVTVSGATDTKHEPKVTSAGKAAPTRLECMDLVVGKGAPATQTSAVTTQYTGSLYLTGTEFNDSWKSGGPVPFTLGQTVPGFTQGIGGAGKVAPMRAGGRRIIILPASLAYGSQSTSGIPANSPLVFVVDLQKVA